MLKNYLKIAFRSLLKNRIYTIINVLGLSIAMASCLLILLHVEDEFSYDKFHENADQVHKVVLERLYPDHVTNYAVIPHSFSDVMVRDFPEVTNATRILGVIGNNPIVVRYVDEQRNEEKVFEELGFISADSTFFQVFDFELISGDKNTVLSKAQNVVITEEMATKYFGTEDPLNKTLKTDFGDYLVTGVCQNVPENSHMDFDFVGALQGIPFITQNENFVGFSTHMYLELAPNASAKDLELKFPQMVETYAAPQIEQNLSTSFADYVAAGNGYNYSLVPLKDIHLNPTKYQGAFKSGGDINDVYIFISIVVLILVIACINFMNLATARSTERSKEVGIRKTLGSPRKQLISQFLTESVVLSMVSSVIAFGIANLFLPQFNGLIEKQLSLLSSNTLVIPTMLIFAILVGLLAGSYPAFVLSSFNPVSVLKGNLKSGKNSAWLRNGLVVFQFTISIILIAGTLIVTDQMNFISNKDLGYDKNQILVVERANILNEQLETFKDEVRKLPSVSAVAGSGALPVNQYFGIGFNIPGSSETVITNGMTMDDDYIETMEFEIISGRGFSEDFNDSLAIVINEQTAALLGLDNPIGFKIRNVQGNPAVEREYQIIGVVKNFHYMSLRDEISPFVLMSSEGAIPGTPYISIRVAANNMTNTLAEVEQTWNSMVPQEPFRYSFLDQELNEQYKTEKTSGNVFTVFATLAIIIACVGLFGLAAYISGLRTKEIGVRKVMGASVGSLIVLLSAQFTKLIFVAIILAIPVSWYFMNEWLSGFAYQVAINPLIFVIAGLTALLIALLTVSYQSIKAAIVNPVKSLRDQ